MCASVSFRFKILFFIPKGVDAVEDPKHLLLFTTDHTRPHRWCLCTLYGFRGGLLMADGPGPADWRRFRKVFVLPHGQPRRPPPSARQDQTNAGGASNQWPHSSQAAATGPIPTAGPIPTTVRRAAASRVDRDISSTVRPAANETRCACTLAG